MRFRFSNGLTLWLNHLVAELPAQTADGAPVLILVFDSLLPIGGSAIALPGQGRSEPTNVLQLVDPLRTEYLVAMEALSTPTAPLAAKN